MNSWSLLKILFEFICKRISRELNSNGFICCLLSLLILYLLWFLSDRERMCMDSYLIR